MSKHTSSAICFRLPPGRDTRQIEVLLIQERHDRNGAKENGQWELPGGKCCRFKNKGEGCCPEQPEDTIRREWDEEVGGKIVIIRLLDTHHRRNFDNGVPYIWNVYLVRPLSPPMEISEEEGRQIKWFQVLEMPKNTFYSHRSEATEAFAFVRCNKSIERHHYIYPESNGCPHIKEHTSHLHSNKYANDSK